MSTQALISDLKAILRFLDHHTDALETGDFGTFTLLPLQNLSDHIESARAGLTRLKQIADAEAKEIAEDFGEIKPHSSASH